MDKNKTPGAREFSIRLSVNYEDTDAAGVVYYGNYPGYMERARNACLRQLGFPLRRFSRVHGAVFAVTEARLKYLAPAFLDDELEVTLQLASLRHASLIFMQQVRRGKHVLVDAQINLAMVDTARGKPRRIPAELMDALRRWSCGYDTSADTVTDGNTVTAGVENTFTAENTATETQTKPQRHAI